MDNIMFTVITVTFNGEKTIRDTLESVLNQTYKNYEYIVIDGESTDNTLNIINEYVPKFQGRMTVISEPDKGIYDAMNKGIKMAKGDIIGIINSDDWYENNTLENVVKNYINDSYIIYHGYLRVIDEKNGKEKRCVLYSPEYINEYMINHPTTFVSKQIYQEFGMFDCQYKMSADYDFVIRMTREPKIQFVSIYEILANFRTGGASNATNALLETMKIKKKYKMMTGIQYFASVVYLYARKIFGYNTI